MELSKRQNEVLDIVKNSSSYDYLLFKKIYSAAMKNNELDNTFLDKVEEIIKEKGFDVNRFYEWAEKERAQELEEQSKRAEFLAPFHTFNEKGNAKDTLDKLIAEYIISNYHIIYIENVPYIYNNGVYKKDEGGKGIKALIKTMIFEHLCTSIRVNRIYKLIEDDKRIDKQHKDINKYSDHLINFKNGMLDVKEWKLKGHDPKYYSINQIPHNFAFDTDFKNSIAYKFICGIIPNNEDRKMLFRYIGYSFSKATYLQKMLVIVGAPGTGKSTLLNLITYAIGEDNISNLELQQLNEKFAIAYILGKVVNICADLPREPMKQVDTIKRITGEDMTKGEYKGGKLFFFRSYAKLIFSANEMPISLDEQSNAWYRRLLMIDVPEKAQHIDNLKQGLKDSVQGFILECMQHYHEMLVNDITKIDSSNSVQLVEELHRETDSVQSFLEDCTTKETGVRTERKILYSKYQIYCSDNDFTELSNRSFYKRLKGKGYQSQRSNGIDYIKNIIYRGETGKNYSEIGKKETEIGKKQGSNFSQVSLSEVPFLL